MRRVHSIGAVLLGAVVVGCGNRGVEPSRASSDAYIQKILDTNRYEREALAWCRQRDGKEHTIGDSSDNMNASGSLRFVEDLYRRGAVDVTAIDIESDPGIESTETLVVTLPSQPEQRRKLFAVDAMEASRSGFDPDEDVGQRYMMFHW